MQYKFYNLIPWLMIGTAIALFWFAARPKNPNFSTPELQTIYLAGGR